MTRKSQKERRKRKAVWKHFNIKGKNGSHPHVECNYCLKDFKRAVPERMQGHLDKKCKKAPNNAKSHQTDYDHSDPSGIRHDGTRTEKNEIEAFELFKAAVEKGDIDSINQLGYCYQYGIGTEQNEVKAFKLYEKAADKGHKESFHHLGECYQHGIGTKKDEIKAFNIYKKFAEKGDVVSMYNLGYFYQDGIGTEKNESKAFEFYAKAAEMYLT